MLPSLVDKDAEVFVEHCAFVNRQWARPPRYASPLTKRMFWFIWENSNFGTVLLKLIKKGSYKQAPIAQKHLFQNFQNYRNEWCFVSFFCYWKHLQNRLEFFAVASTATQSQGWAFDKAPRPNRRKIDQSLVYGRGLLLMSILRNQFCPVKYFRSCEGVFLQILSKYSEAYPSWFPIRRSQHP